MSNIKHIIEIGNCEPGIGQDIKKPEVTPGDVTFDSTTIKFDSTIITFDNI